MSWSLRHHSVFNLRLPACLRYSMIQMFSCAGHIARIIQQLMSALIQALHMILAAPDILNKAAQCSLSCCVVAMCLQEFGVVGYTLLLALIEYKTLVMRGDMDAAAELLPTIPKVGHRPA